MKTGIARRDKKKETGTKHRQGAQRGEMESKEVETRGDGKRHTERVDNRSRVMKGG